MEAKEKETGEKEEEEEEEGNLSFPIVKLRSSKLKSRVLHFLSQCCMCFNKKSFKKFIWLFIYKKKKFVEVLVANLWMNQV